MDQWALDFEGNLERIIQSIKIAKEKGARYRLGSELEVTGYGCEDHFLESDTFLHAWEAMGRILKSDATKDILCDIGMPVMHRNVRYNCRVLVLNNRIVFIKPKMFLAADGNYRENRWFQAWEHVRELESYYLPRMIREITAQETVPFGDGCVALRDTVLSAETCEELWTPAAPHIYHGLNGVEIFGNGSASHHQLRKLNTRVSFMLSATEKNGGIYLYSNQRGCDGGRLYFDGSAMIIMNGRLYAQAPQFSFRDVEVITATLDVEDVRSYRGAIASRGVQASKSASVPRVNVDFDLTNLERRPPTVPIEVKYPLPEEEIAYGPSTWLWDYLRRSRTGGFFLPLSGGADSSSVATMVHIMCTRVVSEIKAGNAEVLRDLRTIVGEPNFTPQTSKEVASKIFYTSYMGSTNSSDETRQRARTLSDAIGATFLPVNIDAITKSFTDTVVAALGKTPRFKLHGGSETENLALQNIQARSRMVLGYYLAQLLPWSRNRAGSLLVLSSANVDESLRGYMTKYDCSSGDLNPIGSIAKSDLKRFLAWAATTFALPVLKEVLLAPPTAELEPMTATYTQTDEADMGMSYDELAVFGRLRKVFRCGPLSMFDKLLNEWSHLPPQTIAEKVKRFFFYYSINRHKMTTLTPSYHAESYSPDDNRFDLRQFLYNSRWTWQFRAIDAQVARLTQQRPAAPPAKL